MELSKRIYHLGYTPLPDDLLQLLWRAKNTYMKGQDVRANSMVNIIMMECKKRDIKVFNPYHHLSLALDEKGYILNVLI